MPYIVSPHEDKLDDMDDEVDFTHGNRDAVEQYVHVRSVIVRRDTEAMFRRTPIRTPLSTHSHSTPAVHSPLAQEPSPFSADEDALPERDASSHRTVLDLTDPGKDTAEITKGGRSGSPYAVSDGILDEWWAGSLRFALSRERGINRIIVDNEKQWNEVLSLIRGTDTDRQLLHKKRIVARGAMLKKLRAATTNTKGEKRKRAVHSGITEKDGEKKFWSLRIQEKNDKSMGPAFYKTQEVVERRENGEEIKEDSVWQITGSEESLDQTVEERIRRIFVQPDNETDIGKEVGVQQQSGKDTVRMHGPKTMIDPSVNKPVGWDDKESQEYLRKTFKNREAPTEPAGQSWFQRQRARAAQAIAKVFSGRNSSEPLAA